MFMLYSFYSTFTLSTMSINCGRAEKGKSYLIAEREVLPKQYFLYFLLSNSNGYFTVHYEYVAKVLLDS